MTPLEAFETVLLAILCVGGSIGLALCAYALGRAFLPSRADKESKDLAGSVIIRVSALHSLILALVFAQELITVHDVRTTVAKEAAMVGDIFYDLKRYDDKATLPTRRELALYVKIVKGAEWKALAEKQELDPRAWGRWEKVYNSILDLEPRTTRQIELKKIMLVEIRKISGLRLDRQNAAQGGLNMWFLSAAIVGIILTAISYFNFAPNSVSLVLISIFGAFSGLILFFIVIFSDPYNPPGSVRPEPFERMYIAEVEALAEQAKPD